MLKRNQLYVSLFASSLALLGSSVAVAQENVTSSASVTVQNAFDLTEVTPLSFGTIRATFVESAGQSSIVLRPNGSTTTTLASGSSTMATLVPGQAAEFAIANASSFTNMTVDLPAGDVELINAQASSQAARFILNTFTFADADTPGTILSGANQTVETDNTGTASILLGATLTTEEAPGGTTTGYVDGDYVGSFTLTVRY